MCGNFCRKCLHRSKRHGKNNKNGK